MTTRALAVEGSAIKKSTRKRLSASRPAYASRWWRSEGFNFSELRARAAKEATKNIYLPPRRRRALKLATKSNVTNAESYGDDAISELQYGPRGPRITTDGMVCVLSGERYMVSASVGVDSRTMHGHDVAADTCSLQLDRPQNIATRVGEVHRQGQQGTKLCRRQ